MKRSFCTLFDKNYLLFAVALNDSLSNYYSKSEYELYALAMDLESYNAMIKMSLPNIIPIFLDDVIGKYRLELSNMTFGQKCWTSQPLLCLYILDNYLCQSITYLEADSYFFSSPEVLFHEIGSKSVSLVPHNYSKRYDQSKSSGIYCVQFNLFLNNKFSRNLLSEWFVECKKYNKSQPNYLPGQLCLDSWPNASDEVVVIKNIGAGVAPWNSSKYKFSRKGAQLFVDNTPIVFFHFHQLSFYKNNAFLTSYSLPKEAKLLVYKEYLAAINKAQILIKSSATDFQFKKMYSPQINIYTANGLKNALRHIYLYLIGNFMEASS